MNKNHQRMKSINFNAGPSAIPTHVMNTIAAELLNWQSTGVSILELGHRTPEFSALNEKLERSLRCILKVPDHFSVLFLPGGAQVQFSTLVMNLIRGFKCANYVETGHWSSIAMKEAQRYTEVHVVASSADQKFLTIPDLSVWDVKPQAAFLHFTDNETIGGVEFQSIPAIDQMVLVSDMSSNVFTRPIDFERIGCVYACAQKNLGIAGMTLVIVRHDLLDRALPETPSVLNYAKQTQYKSLLSTPPTFAFYVASLILDWIEAEGGVDVLAERNAEKSKLLYACIDSHSLYHNGVDKAYRSRMNVPFFLRDKEKEADFFAQAKQQGLLYLEGHRAVGGVRASLYNAITLEQVRHLTGFLDAFALK